MTAGRPAAHVRRPLLAGHPFVAELPLLTQPVGQVGLFEGSIQTSGVRPMQLDCRSGRLILIDAVADAGTHRVPAMTERGAKTMSTGATPMPPRSRRLRAIKATCLDSSAARSDAEAGSFGISFMIGRF